MKNRKISVSKVIIYIILIFWAITTIVPFLWVFLNSFKESGDVLTRSFALPDTLFLDNYKKVFENLNILQAYKNSLIISGSVSIGIMLLSSMFAFGMTRYQFRGKAVINGMISASLMFPVFSTIIPVFRMMVKWGLINNNISVILPQIASNLSFAIIVVTGFLLSIPRELEEAAYMEGANEFQVYLKIILPLSKASLSTVGIFSFLWSYNDLFVQMIMLRERSKYPICTLLNDISSNYGTDFGLLAASVAVIVLPVLVVYIFLQKNIIKGMTAGAIKG